MGNDLIKKYAMTGEQLAAWLNEAYSHQPRELLADLNQYLHNPHDRKVAVLFGLRRTGKTTLMFQSMPQDELDKTAYVVGGKHQSILDIRYLLDQLFDAGYKYVFLDEMTKVKGFSDNASLFADLYSTRGMKVVLSGTDTLGFYFAEDELFDRVNTYSTTHIPFNEFLRIKGGDIHSYIESGGILSSNSDERETIFKKSYTLRAISYNIQHALEEYHNQRYFMQLEALWNGRLLTGAINKVVQNDTHAFTAKVLNKAFFSRDIGSAIDLLSKRKGGERANQLLVNIKNRLNAQLAQKLQIKNGITISDLQSQQIREYLFAIDVIEPKPIRAFNQFVTDIGPDNMIIQPGLRWAHVQLLCNQLLSKPISGNFSTEEINLVRDIIQQDVKGHMLEDIVIQDTKKYLPSNFHVFQQQLPGGEIDMVIHDQDNNAVVLCEIKLSSKAVYEQGKHLHKEQVDKYFTDHYGHIANKIVLSNIDKPCEMDGVQYLNVEDYLTNLHNIQALFKQHQSFDPQ